MSKFEEQLKKQTEIPKNDFASIIKKSSYEMAYALVFVAFFVFSNYAFYNIQKTALIKDFNILAFTYLGASILFFEYAFKNDDTKKCINGIEILLMGIFTLSLPWIYQVFTNSFINALKIVGVLVILYYLIKTLITFFKLKGEYLRAKDDYVKEYNEADFDLDEDDTIEEDKTGLE